MCYNNKYNITVSKAETSPGKSSPGNTAEKKEPLDKRPLLTLREELHKLAEDLTKRENEIKVLQVESEKAKAQV